MGKGTGEVLNLPLLYRTFTHEVKDTLTLVFNPVSQRVVFGEDEYMYRQINGLTLELLTSGYRMGENGRFESNGL
jgi:hypothetical protein